MYVGGDPANADCGVDRHLVCEQRQVYGDDRCKNDPSYTPADDDPASGWCYARSRDVITSQCRPASVDYAGVIRFVGGVKQHDGSELYAACDACMFD